jgi:NAD-dependent dihydropyrimidine dehydrogenase PreA subunit
MNDDVYRKLAQVLDTLPNGFRATDDGLEIRLLKRIFDPDEAELFCDLKLSFETAEQIAERTGRPLDGLEEQLTCMWKEKGQIQGIKLGEMRVFKLLPWAIGIYEAQLARMDRELAQLCNEYNRYFIPAFLPTGPQLMRTIPIDEQVAPTQEALPYDRVSGIIEAGQAFLLNDCICKKEEKLLDNGCDHPLEVCLAVAPVPGIFDDPPSGRSISKEEAYSVLEEAEDAGLVHLTSNVASGHYFICNCCGCCCAVLKGMTKHGLTNVVNTDFYSEIHTEPCTGCGLCVESVCQVDAISEKDEIYGVDRALCLGCGNCVGICPADAIQLQRKRPEDRVTPPADHDAWLDERARIRGVDYSMFR